MTEPTEPIKAVQCVVAFDFILIISRHCTRMRNESFVKVLQAGAVGGGQAWRVARGGGGRAGRHGPTIPRRGIHHPCTA